MAMLLEDGRWIERLAYYPSAEATIEAGLQQAREHSGDSNPAVTIRVAP